MAKIPQYDQIPDAGNAEWHVVDVTDPTDDPTGTSKRLPFSQLQSKLEMSELLRADDLTTQTPTGLGVPLQITLGPAQGSGTDPVQLLADGSIVFNKTGLYCLIATFAVGRSSSTQVALTMLRMLLNGGQVGVPRGVTNDDADSMVTLQFTVNQTFSAGDVVTAEVIRDSAYHNSGELQAVASADGFGTSPSASVRVYG